MCRRWGLAGAKDWEEVGPGAAALVESLRSVGYSLETAVADLIDNCVTAKAAQVWLNFEWEGADSWLSIRDDGEGMSEAELVSAMRPGSRSPLEERSASDLGRFGLGLKTASFSQCRRLTVFSKRKSGPASTRQWDLDYVRETNEWRLLRAASELTRERLGGLDKQRSGTVLLWEKMDRIVRSSSVSDDKAQTRFLREVERVKRHLGMVFHRLIEADRLTIFVNGTSKSHRVAPWNPFEPDALSWKTETAELSSCSFKGFVLPHRDRLTEVEFASIAGPSGWTNQQGFYVYRNDRMLVSGGWLDLGLTNEEPYRLARIWVDIPSSVESDSEWEIDIKKSRARPPGESRDHLRRVADIVRKQAREVFASRGVVLRGNKQKPQESAWLIVEGQRRRYRINREHSLLKPILADGGAIALEGFLKLVEETVPIERIWLDTAESRSAAPNVDASPSPDDAQRTAILNLLTELRDALVKQGHSAAEALALLRNMDPFHRYPDLVASLA